MQEASSRSEGGGAGEKPLFILFAGRGFLLYVCVDVIRQAGGDGNWATSLGILGGLIMDND